MFRLFCTVPLALFAGPLIAEPSLSLPIDCTLGETCYIQQFVDRDPGPGAQDFRCGTLSYDGHSGTDIALLSLAAQAAGVAVLAATDGTVRGLRSDMADVLQGSAGAPDVTGRECGNGLVLEHPDGWETQYCHMARGLLLVAVGDDVVRGQPLGRVGLSGESTFPHLHLSVRHAGAEVDPFDTDDQLRCGPTNPALDPALDPASDPSSGPDLWLEPLPYQPGGLISVGFSTAVPGFDVIRSGAASPSLARDSPLVMWGYLFGARAGDTVAISIEGPDGTEVFAHEETMERTQAALFRAGGRRAPAGGWVPGSYTGTVTLRREGAVRSEMSGTAELP